MSRYDGNMFASRPVLEEIDDIEIRNHYVDRSWEMHFHNYYELELVLDGKGTQTINGVELPFERGCITFISPVDFHELRMEKPWHVINLSFNVAILPERLTEILLSAGKSITDLSEDEISEMEAVMNQIQNEYNTSDGYSHRVMGSLIEYILVLFKRSLDKRTPSSGDNDATPISRALHYIFEHYLESPTLEEVAAVSGYSPTYFSKIFHKITRRKYSDFLSTMKINYAKMLILSTKMTSIDIAYACGFKSSQTFYRIFKKNTGMFPKEYRASIIKSQKEG